MDIDKINNIYFIGIGGIGMSALARYFKAKGCYVAGYDRTRTFITEQLTQEGIDIHYEENVKLLPQELDLVVYTPAIPPAHKELQYLKNKKLTIKKRAEILGWITKDKFTIAIAGTHGKTSVSSLTAHILKSSGYDCTAFIGGISLNYQSNYIEGKNDVYIVEADEYDRSFLQIQPDIAVVTAIDTDHLDIYKTQGKLSQAFEQFIAGIKPEGTLLLRKHINTSLPDTLKKYNYSGNVVCDFYANNITIEKVFNSNTDKLYPCYLFDFKSDVEDIARLFSFLPGLHNIENTVAAVAISQLLGIANKKIKIAVASFNGIMRRFEYHIISDEITYIDDYAHHPKEIEVTINTVRQLYPDNKITVVFQPHLFSRTRDLSDAFGKSLSLADEVILLDIYPAREQPIDGVTSQLILTDIQSKNKMLCSKDELLEILEEKDIEILLTLGAGDINQLVNPIKKLLNKKLKRIEKQKAFKITKTQINGLKQFFDGEVLINEPMSNHTTLKIGGPADIFLKTKTKEGILKVVQFLKKENIPYLIIGRGSNMLVGDKGIRGVVIALKYGLDYVRYQNNDVSVGAACDWPKLTLETIKAGYQGLETIAGIPGTVGGIVAMNAGAYGTEVFDLLKEIKVIRNNKIVQLTPDQVHHDYRYTNLTNDVILEATFTLNKVDDNEPVLKKRKELLDKRNAAQPLSKPCAGSIFKNPENDFAGRLIEAVGLKGLQYGQVQVSPKHANFIVNLGNGTAKEMIELIEIVRKKVFAKFGIMLIREVKKFGEGF